MLCGECVLSFTVPHSAARRTHCLTFRADIPETPKTTLSTESTRQTAPMFMLMLACRARMRALGLPRLTDGSPEGSGITDRC